MTLGALLTVRYQSSDRPEWVVNGRSHDRPLTANSGRRSAQFGSPEAAVARTLSCTLERR
jgi:hypothetical protein